MAGPSTAFLADSSGNVSNTGALTKFDLEVRLDNSEFHLDMGVTIGSNNYFTNPNQTNSAIGPISNTFSFNAGVNGGGCSGGCLMNVDGFFAGDGANQAGVTYQFQDSGDTIYCAAGIATSASGL